MLVNMLYSMKLLVSQSMTNLVVYQAVMLLKQWGTLQVTVILRRDYPPRTLSSCTLSLR